MKKFQSRTVVEAIQFDGSIESGDEVRSALLGYASCFNYIWPPEGTQGVLSFQQRTYVEDVSAGDWVVLLPNDDIAIIPDNVFNERYEQYEIRGMGRSLI